jgi:lysozyme
MNDLAPALSLIKKFEGCVLHAYQDSVGVWTIGWGHTAGVHKGQVITQAEADALLFQEVVRCHEQVKTLVHVPCSNNEFCALTSFAYNLGIGALKKSSLLRRLNAGEIKEEVSFEFLKWDHANGKVLLGLTRRRKAERALFLQREVIAA